MQSPLIVVIVLIFLAAHASLSQTRSARPVDGKQAAASAFEEGQNAQERGDLNSAVRLYTTAVSADPSLFQAFYQRATALLALGRESEAEADLRSAIKLEPGFARAHRALGQMLLDRGATDEARRELARAIELDPKLSGVRIYYASAQIKSGDHAGAVETLRAAFSMGEETALAHALLGVAAERLGRADEAFSSYTRAVEMDAANATAREGRGRLFEGRGEIAKAIEEYSLAYKTQPAPDLAVKLAQLHQRAGQPQAAVQLYRRLVLEKPDDLALRVELARVMAENGQAEDAIKDVEKLLASRPNDARLLVLLADLSFKDQPDKAVGYYRKASEADPKDNRARVQLGAALVRSMQFEAALPVLGDAIAREPDNYQAHANLATAHFKLKQYLEAAREFIWILKAQPETPASYYFLAISLDRLGDCQQAYRAYQEFVRRADAVANKKEVEEANIRLSLLQKLVNEKKCRSLFKGKEK